MSIIHSTILIIEFPLPMSHITEFISLISTANTKFLNRILDFLFLFCWLDELFFHSLDGRNGLVSLTLFSLITCSFLNNGTFWWKLYIIIPIIFFIKNMIILSFICYRLSILNMKFICVSTTLTNFVL